MSFWLGTLEGQAMVGVYAGSALGWGMERNTLNVPEKAPLPTAPQISGIPFVMVGDAAFPMKTYLMQPYPGPNLTKREADGN